MPIIIIIMFITFYNYISEANNVSKAHSVGVFAIYVTRNVISHFQCVLYFYNSTSAVCVRCPIWLFFVVPWFRAQVLSEWLWDAFTCPHYYWYHFAFAFHMSWFLLNGLYLIIIIIIIIIIVVVLKPLSRQSSINSSKADSRVRWFNYRSVAEIQTAMETESMSETLLDWNHFTPPFVAEFTELSLLLLLSTSSSTLSSSASLFFQSLIIKLHYLNVLLTLNVVLQCAEASHRGALFFWLHV